MIELEREKEHFSLPISAAPPTLPPRLEKLHQHCRLGLFLFFYFNTFQSREMSELWCDYEARINWLQMYSMPPMIIPSTVDNDDNEPVQAGRTHKRRKNEEDPLSPRSKRAARCTLMVDRSPSVDPADDTDPVETVPPPPPPPPQLRSGHCDQCPAEIQFYRGAANRTYREWCGFFKPEFC